MRRDKKREIAAVCIVCRSCVDGRLTLVAVVGLYLVDTYTPHPTQLLSIVNEEE
jgi:hypothetical protein